MPFYGYARVSTAEQDLGPQEAALRAAGCRVVRAERATGAHRGGQPDLQALLDFLRAGDALA
jgi:DNA invertase Pin-like site-specific DNA recombinase